MTITQARETVESKFGIEQTPADWLNEFDTRGEAYAAWLESKIEVLRDSGEIEE